MIETRFITTASHSTIKGGSMRVTILGLEFDAPISVATDEFKGVDVFAAGSQLHITYVDSPVYRRLVVLAIARALPNGAVFAIVSKRSIVMSRQVASLNDEAQHIPIIQKQIEWARRNTDEAAAELDQMVALLRVSETLAERAS